VHLVGYIIGTAAIAITYCNIYNIFLPAYSIFKETNLSAPGLQLHVHVHFIAWLVENVTLPLAFDVNHMVIPSSLRTLS